MAPYVPNVEHDIFISYAHVDNEVDALEVQWVSDFQALLKTGVRQYLGGHEIDVFFDDIELHPNHQIETVLARARNSAIFIPIISKSYVQRRWTQAELKAFTEAAPDPGRIFAIELLPPEKGYPPELDALKRKAFWFRDEKQGIAPRKLTRKYRSDIYSEHINEIAYLIAKRLDEMHPQVKAPAASKITGMKILLADVTDDLRREREQVCKYLEPYGVVVLPNREYPEGSAEFVEAFQADLKEAALFVHLLSEVRSTKLDHIADPAERPSRARFQFEAAKTTQIPVLQWLHPDAKPQSVSHWDKPLIDGTLPGSRIEMIGLEQFKKTVKETLERLNQPVAVPDRDPHKPYVFITADEKDQARAVQLQDSFVEEECVASLLGADETPKAKRKRFKEKVQIADAVVFFYGEASDQFIGGWLDEYVKNGQAGQRRVEAVYHAPPEGKPDVPVRWRELLPFGSRKAFTLDDVKKIRAMLRRDNR